MRHPSDQIQATSKAARIHAVQESLTKPTSIPSVVYRKFVPAAHSLQYLKRALFHKRQPRILPSVPCPSASRFHLPVPGLQILPYVIPFVVFHPHINVAHCVPPRSRHLPLHRLGRLRRLLPHGLGFCFTCWQCWSFVLRNRRARAVDGPATVRLVRNSRAEMVVYRTSPSRRNVEDCIVEHVGWMRGRGRGSKPNASQSCLGWA